MLTRLPPGRIIIISRRKGAMDMSKDMPAWKQAAYEKFMTLYQNFKAETKKTDETIADEIDMSLNTMKYTLNGKGFSLDFAVAFCRTYHVDTNYLFSDVRDASAYVAFQLSRDCRPLEDEAFFGTFHGYCRNTQADHWIEHFVLKISKEGRNDARATFTLHGRSQRGESVTKVLTGKPMHLKPYSIYITLQSESGDDMFELQYNWFKISPGKNLYFREGGLITPTRATSRYWQMQTFVMMDKPLASKHMLYLDGAMRMVQDQIIVPADRYNEKTGGLMATNENVKAFFSQCEDLQYSEKDVYCFSEKVLTAMGEAHGIDDAVTAATILTLRANSVNPKVVDYPDNKLYSKFFAGLTADEEQEE